MPFMPAIKQVNSLHFLLHQLIREKIEIRLIRFSSWGNKIEVLCLEDEDRYYIYPDGKIKKE